MVLENGVKNIQAAAYNGARMVVRKVCNLDRPEVIFFKEYFMS